MKSRIPCCSLPAFSTCFFLLLLQVCEEQACEDQVFAVAINFLDRFLCACVVQRTQLQLLGAVCLLLASKLRQCRPLSIELLAYYTDYSVGAQEIKVRRAVVIPAFSLSFSVLFHFYLLYIYISITCFRVLLSSSTTSGGTAVGLHATIHQNFGARVTNS